MIGKNNKHFSTKLDSHSVVNEIHSWSQKKKNNTRYAFSTLEIYFYNISSWVGEFFNITVPQQQISTVYLSISTIFLFLVFAGIMYVKERGKIEAKSSKTDYGHNKQQKFLRYINGMEIFFINFYALVECGWQHFFFFLENINVEKYT